MRMNILQNTVILVVSMGFGDDQFYGGVWSYGHRLDSFIMELYMYMLYTCT